MKSVVTAVLALLLVTAGSVLAAPVTVDFTQLGGSVVDLAAGYTLNGVTFTYNNFGGTDTATVDSSGVFGGTNGLLTLDFNWCVGGLTFTYSILGVSGVTPPISDGVIAIFNNGAPALSVPADFCPGCTTDLVGTLAYGTLATPSGWVGPFTSTGLYFSTSGPFFTIDSLTYDTVPEPASLLLLACGLVGFGAWRRLKRS